MLSGTYFRPLAGAFLFTRTIYGRFIKIFSNNKLHKLQMLLECLPSTRHNRKATMNQAAKAKALIEEMQKAVVWTTAAGAFECVLNATIAEVKHVNIHQRTIDYRDGSVLSLGEVYGEEIKALLGGRQFTATVQDKRA